MHTRRMFAVTAAVAATSALLTFNAHATLPDLPRGLEYTMAWETCLELGQPGNIVVWRATNRTGRYIGRFDEPDDWTNIDDYTVWGPYDFVALDDPDVAEACEG